MIFVHDFLISIMPYWLCLVFNGLDDLDVHDDLDNSVTGVSDGFHDHDVHEGLMNVMFVLSHVGFDDHDDLGAHDDI